MQKRRFDLIGIGPLFEDLIINVPREHAHKISYSRGAIRSITLEAGLKVEVTQFSRTTGGSSANLLCMLRHLGDYTIGYFTKLGLGAVSDWLLEDLENHGINSEGIIREDGEPGVSVIVTQPPIKDRSVISYRGLGDMISVVDIDQKKNYLLDTEWYNIDSFTRAASIEAVMHIVDLGKKRGVKLFFTPSMSMISLFKEETMKIASCSQLLSLNDAEARQLSGINDVKIAARFLKNQGPPVVFVTLGKEGILAVDHERCYKIGAYQVKAVNTVGAGDTCAAVFWDGLHRKLEMKEVLQRASAASSIKVQTPGAKKGLPSNLEIEEFLRKKGRKPVKTEPARN
jgi:sugar/nucleoside kinase (ribokinase family)